VEFGDLWKAPRSVPRLNPAKAPPDEMTMGKSQGVRPRWSGPVRVISWVLYNVNDDAAASQTLRPRGHFPRTVVSEHRNFSSPGLTHIAQILDAYRSFEVTADYAGTGAREFESAVLPRSLPLLAESGRCRGDAPSFGYFCAQERENFVGQN